MQICNLSNWSGILAGYLLSFLFLKKKNEASIDDHNWVKLLSEEKIDEVS